MEIREFEIREFTVACRLCGTRQVFRLDQVGTTVRCPDCHCSSVVGVPDPESIRTRRVVERSEGSAASGDDGELHLTDAPSSGSSGDAMSAAVHRSIADELLAKARAEMEAEEPAEPVEAEAEVPPFLAFVPDLQLAGVVSGLSLGLYLEAAAVRLALKLWESESPVDAFVCMLLLAFGMVFGVLLTGLLLACCLAVLRDTVNRCERVESWPAFDFWESLFSALSVLINGLLAGLPGYLAGLAAGWVLEIPWLSGVFLGLSLYGLFPVFLLSALDQESFVFPISRGLLRTISRYPGRWLRTYLASALLLGLAAGGAAMGSFLTLGWSFLGMLIMVLALFLYFRLLGWLVAGCLQEPETELAEPPEVIPDSSVR